MKIGCCASFSEYDLIVEAGFDFIEIKGIELMNMSADALYKTQKKLAQGSIPCPILNGNCNRKTPLLGPDYDRDSVRAYARELAQRMTLIGAKKIGVGAPFARSIPEGYPFQIAYNQFLEAMRVTAYEFAQRDIKVMLEPLSKPTCNFLCKTKEVVAFVQQVEETGFSYLIDFYHAEREEDDLDVLSSYLPDSSHIHLSGSDKTARTYLLSSDEQTYRKWAKLLRKADYHNTVSLEISHQHLLEGAVASEKWMRVLFS